MFKNPFSFNGRVRRLEYGLSYLFFYIYWMIIVVLLVQYDLANQPANYKYGDKLVNASGSLIIFISYIPALWFLLAQGTKRCHDRGNSGWWQLIPFYGFWMMFADGEIGDNEYGENPKGLNYDREDEKDKISLLTK
jgi:uncharacterized membrane protein YhaH (DUF805 family)